MSKWEGTSWIVGLNAPNSRPQSINLDKAQISNVFTKIDKIMKRVINCNNYSNVWEIKTFDEDIHLVKGYFDSFVNLPYYSGK